MSDTKEQPDEERPDEEILEEHKVDYLFIYVFIFLKMWLVKKLFGNIRELFTELQPAGRANVWRLANASPWWLKQLCRSHEES